MVLLNFPQKIEGVMRQEYRLAVQLTLKPDFVEGVRAVLVDKDQVSPFKFKFKSNSFKLKKKWSILNYFVMFTKQNPKWIPNSLDDVAPADVAAIFEPLGENIAELAV